MRDFQLDDEALQSDLTRIAHAARGRDLSPLLEAAGAGGGLEPYDMAALWYARQIPTDAISRPRVDSRAAAQSLRDVLAAD